MVQIVSASIYQTLLSCTVEQQFFLLCVPTCTAYTRGESTCHMRDLVCAPEPVRGRAYQCYITSLRPLFRRKSLVVPVLP